MTPEQADEELWAWEPAIRYETELLLRWLERGAERAIRKDRNRARRRPKGAPALVVNMRLTDAGSLVIERA